MINKKYLKKRDIVFFNDMTMYKLPQRKIDTFEQEFDFNRITRITRLLTNQSASFIGVIKSENAPDKIAIWLNDDRKYATTKFKIVSDKDGVRKYNIILWEKTAV